MNRKIYMGYKGNLPAAAGINHKRGNIMIKKIICLMCISIFWISVYAQSDVPDVVTGYKRIAQSGFGFLAIPVGGRAAAMGDALNGARGDVLSMFHNLAGIAFIEKTEAMFSETYWLVDTKLHAGAIAIPVGNLGVAGISFMSMDYGVFHGTEIDATNLLGWRETGDFEVGELALGIGFARRLTANFTFGAQIKYVNQDLGKSGIYDSGTGERESINTGKDIIAADLGMIYDTDFRGIALSMSMRNFGPDVQYQLNSFEIPLIFKVGVSTTLQELIGFQSDIHSVNLFIDAVHPNDWSERIYIGGEYCFHRNLFLRAGYKFNHSAEGLTLGCGVNVPAVIGRLSVDYAYKSTNDSGFDYVHILSISGAF
ncbi:PorV/PorQ family protein [bacterium]|nr:PorV/PorQ family protein [bacterium]